MYRSLHGYNDNPTQQQFKSSYRKILVNSTVFTSKKANCVNFDSDADPFTDVLFVSSRRPLIKKPYDENEPPPEVQDVHDQLDKIEYCEANGLFPQNVSDLTIAHIANTIEDRMKSSDRYCDLCMRAFEENDKVETCFTGRAYTQKPCRSTYKICKETDRYLKVQFLREKRYFNAACYIIATRINVDTLYMLSDFSHNPNHKLCLVEIIINAYIQIKSTYLAKQANFTAETENMRARLHKLIHFYGQ